MDFSIRGIFDDSKVVFLLVDLGILALPILLYIYSPNILNFILYFLSFVSLKLLSFFEKKHAK